MRIKFYLVPGDFPAAAYHHEMVAVAEGLRELGVEYYGTLDYWKEPDSGDYLIKKAPADFEAEINIYSGYYFNFYKIDIDKADYSKINILIDKEDGYYSLFSDKRYHRFDLILRTHYNKNIPYTYYQKNIKPWAFGLSYRMIKSIDESLHVQIENKVNVNFRISHDLRELAYEKFSPIISQKYPIDLSSSLPSITGKPFKSDSVKKENIEENVSEADKLYRLQTGFRHDLNYYYKLNSSLLTYAFGGCIYNKPFLTNRLVHPINFFYKTIRSGYKFIYKETDKFIFINQYDSWRWWEALYSNTCPIHMDFDDWGWVLPVMPQNKVHYWGVKKMDFEKCAKQLLQLTENDILQIGINGRNWAEQHYSPVATANRLIDLIEEIKQKKYRSK